MVPGAYISPGLFSGRLTDLNVWNTPLRDDDVMNWTSGCSRSLAAQRLVLDWTKVGAIEGFGKLLRPILSDEACSGKKNGNFLSRENLSLVILVEKTLNTAL